MNDTTPVSRRRLPFWLVLSLMANMMLIGLLAGMLLRPAPPQPLAGQGEPKFDLVQKDGEGAEISNVLRKAFEASEQQREARVAVRKALGEAVEKDPYDEEAVRQAFEALRQADNAVIATTHETMTVLFATLTPEQRRHMARILMHGPDERRPMRRPGERPAMPRGDKDNGPDFGPGDGPPPPDFDR